MALLANTPSSVTGVSTGEYENSLTALNSAGVNNPVVDLSSSYDALIGKSESVASSLLAGKIPADVQKQIQMQSAERGLKNGLGAGSPAARGLVARDLGRTSLDLQQAGLAASMQLAQLGEQKRSNTLSYLSTQRGQDLAGRELVEKSRQSNVNAQLSVQQLLAQSTEAYHNSIVNMLDVGATAEQTAPLAKDFAKLIAGLRSLFGEG